jgi:hypothetical protein
VIFEEGFHDWSFPATALNISRLVIPVGAHFGLFVFIDNLLARRSCVRSLKRGTGGFGVDGEDQRGLSRLIFLFLGHNLITR